jgi:DNA-binding SARP family transcriptional activator
MRFEILGPIRAYTDSGEATIPAGRERVLLAMLLLHAGDQVPAEVLIDAMWGEDPPRQARNQVHKCVSQLRRRLAEVGIPGKLVVTEAGGYRANVDRQTVDLWRFRQLRDDARAAAADQRLDEARRRYRAALDLWHWPAMIGIDSPLVRRSSAALDEERLLAYEECVETELALGEAGDLIAELTDLTQQHPHRERLHGALMLALFRAGRQADALAAYRDARQVLKDELGTEPGQELRRLHQAILNHDPELAMGRPAARAAAPPVPHELPAEASGFTGRTGALAALGDLLAQPAAAPGPVVISAIAGTAGVGKTALAVHWAHRIADRFPDGQLFVDLRGYASGPAERPVEALAAMLRSLGTPPEQIPAEEEQAAALYRSRLAGRRVLVVLDNAGSADQVRPLLPGSPSCLALVTSRDRLAGLVARDGAHRVSLDVLDASEAVTLLTRLLGAERVHPEPAATAELVKACAYLPLALRIAAADLADRPRRTVAEYVAELTSGDRLAALAADADEETAVRAALDLSYRSIPAETRRLFRLLGLVPGSDVTAAAAAALAAVEVPAAERLLDRLAGAHLIREHVTGRYAFHDLLRLYAGQLTEARDPAAERRAASARLYDWYLHNASAAADLLYPQMLRLPAVPVETPLPPASFTEPAGALAWLDTELSNLVAAVRHAVDHGPRPPAWRLADCLRGYFIRRRHAVAWQAAASSALAAGEREHDLQAQAAAKVSLADVSVIGSHYPAAIEHYTDAAELARRASWVDGEAAAVGNLGMAYRDRGLVSRAAELFGRALALCERSGRLGGQATTRSKLAVVDMELGRLREAADHHAGALPIYRQLGSVDGEAMTLLNLGLTYHELGRLDLADRYLQEASALRQEVGDRVLHASILDGFAMVRRDAGQLAEATAHSEAALATLAGISDRRYEAVLLVTRASLHLLAGQVSAAIDTYQRALHLARLIDVRLPEIDAMLGQATSYQRLGDHQAADRLAADALDRAEAAGYRIMEGKGLTVRAEIRCGQGRYEEAGAYARRALDNQRDTGHRYGEARTLAVLARIAQATGDPAAAARYRGEGAALFEDAGAPVPGDLRSGSAT